MRVFISGHLDISSQEFEEHYASRIREHIKAGDSFVVGDARGADLAAQVLLWAHEADVTVYHMFARPRNCRSVTFKTVGGFSTDEERDAAMTANSDLDLCWVRPGRENSGTANNLARRSK